jgi:phosphoribosylaminoimidazolecarboxamide formyltransferase/IMP cyclohydrolase
MRAIISVSDKKDLATFAGGLAATGVEIFSTGGTLRALEEANVRAHSISTLTNFPETLDGRVKTLHPAVHGGILYRRNDPAHQAQVAQHGIQAIDLVVVNLYPFAQTIAQPDVTLDDALEQIDIGGPTLVRAAAKNFPDVLVVVDPADYTTVLEALQNGQVDLHLRQRLAAKAFAHTAGYDSTIANYLSTEPFPATLPLAWHKAHDLRYGENPHQPAALYGTFFDFFEQLHGKELSYINILDIAAAQELIEEFDPADGCALAIIKHTNPCGVGVGATQVEAWERAFATDREAPFGGIIVVNQPLERELAEQIAKLFVEIVIAPGFADDAWNVLSKKKNVRLMHVREPVSQSHDLLLHSVPGGVLVQMGDRAPLADEAFEIVTERAPSSDETRALRFAWCVVKHVKSNAVVYSAADRTLGIGAGQMSRVDSSRIAVQKAQHAQLSLQGSVIASDALFPFPDAVEVAAAAGATAVIQPGGAVRDGEVIDAANRLGLAMVFTKRRHFKH